MPPDLFDKSREYDALLNQGLRLTGEPKEYFAAERIRDLRAQLGPGFAPRRILDFGCGIGDTARLLAEAFPGARVVGVDTAGAAIGYARERYGSAQLDFVELSSFEPSADFDLCYCSGVFHHISKSERTRAVQWIWDGLVAGGRFALFENNPWNLGTRAVMKLIPFDADAVPIDPNEAGALIRAARWDSVSSPRFLFYFPRWLAPLRVLEPRLVHIPLGGQYYLIALKPGKDVQRERDSHG
jgi:SAM-dependent methyltransferase